MERILVDAIASGASPQSGLAPPQETPRLLAALATLPSAVLEAPQVQALLLQQVLTSSQLSPQNTWELLSRQQPRGHAPVAAPVAAAALEVGAPAGGQSLTSSAPAAATPPQITQEQSQVHLGLLDHLQQKVVSSDAESSSAAAATKNLKPAATKKEPPTSIAQTAPTSTPAPGPQLATILKLLNSQGPTLPGHTGTPSSAQVVPEQATEPTLSSQSQQLASVAPNIALLLQAAAGNSSPSLLAHLTRQTQQPTVPGIARATAAPTTNTAASLPPAPVAVCPHTALATEQNQLLLLQHALQGQNRSIAATASAAPILPTSATVPAPAPLSSTTTQSGLQLANVLQMLAGQTTPSTTTSVAQAAPIPAQVLPQEVQSQTQQAGLSSPDVVALLLQAANGQSNASLVAQTSTQTQQPTAEGQDITAAAQLLQQAQQQTTAGEQLCTQLLHVQQQGQAQVSQEFEAMRQAPNLVSASTSPVNHSKGSDNQTPATKYPMDNIETPGPHDVLLGRGSGASNHIGNIRYRMLILEYKPKYNAASRVDKPKVAHEIVQVWRNLAPPGRFLAQCGREEMEDADDPRAERWKDVGDSRAKTKTCQCLREKERSRNARKNHGD